MAVLPISHNAPMKCSFGSSPMLLRLQMGPQAVATALDNKPIINIPPAGVCMSPANPHVAAATAASAGQLTPMPCIPGCGDSPWTPESLNLRSGSPPRGQLMQNSTLVCRWGGIITLL